MDTENRFLEVMLRRKRRSAGLDARSLPLVASSTVLPAIWYITNSHSRMVCGATPSRRAASACVPKYLMMSLRVMLRIVRNPHVMSIGDNQSCMRSPMQKVVDFVCGFHYIYVHTETSRLPAKLTSGAISTVKNGPLRGHEGEGDTTGCKAPSITLNRATKRLGGSWRGWRSLLPPSRSKFGALG